MDIVEGSLVREFVEAILIADNIRYIQYIRKEDAPILSGFAARDGMIVILLKPGIEVDFGVGGLVFYKVKRYWFSKKKRNIIQLRGSNLDQRPAGYPKIYR